MPVGRPRKPTALRIAEGDLRKIGKHKLEELLEAEPKPERGLPRCPTRLTGLARRTWKGWAEQLELMNMDSRPDAEMLEGACTAFALATECWEEIGRTGKMLRLPDGSIVVNPLIRVWHLASKQYKGFCTEFGFSPVSRSRLGAAAVEKEGDDLEDLLLGPRLVKTGTENP